MKRGAPPVPKPAVRRREWVAGALALAAAPSAWAHAARGSDVLPALNDADAQPQLELARRVIVALARLGEPLPATDVAAIDTLAQAGRLKAPRTPRCSICSRACWCA